MRAAVHLQGMGTLQEVCVQFVLMPSLTLLPVSAAWPASDQGPASQSRSMANSSAASSKISKRLAPQQLLQQQTS
jgi:hypothetical protein